MFSRLFRPKWEHPDAKKRLQALLEGEVPTEALIELAGNDPDTAVRCQSIGQLDDLDPLGNLLKDANTEVSEAAAARLCQLLCQPAEQKPALEARVGFLRQTVETALLRQLAREAAAVEIREFALERVEDPELLITLAVDDPVASLRLKALERITDPQAWERVAQQTRNKDKNVSRLARQRLDAYNQEQAALSAAEGICAELEQLAGESAWSADGATRFQLATTRWTKLGISPPAELSERFRLVSSQLGERQALHEAQRTERAAICNSLDELVRQIETSDPETLDLDELNAQRNACEARWQAVKPAPAEQEAVTARYKELVAGLRESANRLVADRKQAERQRGLLCEAKALLDQTAPVGEGQINKLQQRWERLHLPHSSQLGERLQEEFQQQQKALRTRLKQQVKEAEQALEEAESMVKELDESLSQGQLEHAISLRNKINHRLKLAHGLADKRVHTLRDALHARHTKIEELRTWRHWGSDTARHRLCEEIEELPESGLEAADIAAKVRNARKAWQHIDQAEGPAKEGLWQRFDQACTKAYEPYQEERHKQEEILHKHLEQKKKLCAELDAFAQETDWQNVDWREIEQRLNKARTHWRSIGPAPRKETKPLEREFQGVIKRFEEQLAPEREKELRRRKLMIARIQELADSKDLKAAVNEVKAAQSKWKPTIPLARKEEQALWEEFHTACDAIFKLAREVQETAAQERSGNLEQKQALCDELKKLLDDPALGYQELHPRFDEARKAWEEIGELPRKEERGIEKRFADLEHALEQRRLKEREAAAEARLDNLRQRAGIVARLEQAVLDSTDEEARVMALQQATDAWHAQPPLDDRHVDALRVRFNDAAAAMRGNADAQERLSSARDENLRQRQELCLRLEVLNGVESPPEFAEDRMQYQVSRLAGALHKNFEPHQSPAEQVRQLEIDWLLAGPVEASLRPALEERFNRARKDEKAGAKDVRANSDESDPA